MATDKQRAKRLTTPGINPQAKLGLLSADEKQIVNNLSKKYWYVTRVVNIGGERSSYNVVFLKPVDYITQNFNLTREVVLIFTPYSAFEPRTLDVLDDSEIRVIRLEEVCCLVVSKDPDIERVLNTFMKSNAESRVIVPFTYDELLDSNNAEFIIGQMRRCFYSRDLFGIQDPLKKELYFFGRRDLIQELVNKHNNDENAGIFGLRKTGKTSIIYGVMRTLDRKKSFALLVDCQTLHLQSWNMALRKIIWDIVNNLQLKQQSFRQRLPLYSNESEAAIAFETDLKEILTISKKDVLLIFDEIENITFDTSISQTWKSGESFIKFWQVVRSFGQHNNTKRHFSYLIAGTNPRCIEVPSIDRVDNPIFAQFTPIYISPFNFEHTDEMLSRLGGYMGIRFDKHAVSALVSDFGGHPLLIRQMASYIHKQAKNERPIVITKHEYEEYKEQFYRDETGFAQYAVMILQVLADWYDIELEMLKMLAKEDINDFKELAEDGSYIKHLKSYGIIEADSTRIGYHFKIEALERYLSNKLKYHRYPANDEGRELELQSRRSAIEKALRRMVKRQLKSSLGENKAKEEMIRAIYEPKVIGHHMNKQYAEFFDPDKHNIFLKTLFDVIIRNYECFKNIFDVPLEEFKNKAELLNRYRRAEAHSAKISKEDFSIFRGISSWFERILSDE